jgi:hypothetical protein
MRARDLFLCAALAGCAQPSSPVPPKPVVKAQTEVVVRIERVRVPVRLNPARLTCPADPVFPFFPTQRQLGAYIARLIEVADQCRANLQSLNARTDHDDR